MNLTREQAEFIKFVVDGLVDIPAECQTEAEKRAYCFGWWKALEQRPVATENAWRDALENAGVISWTLTDETKDNPRKLLEAIIKWNVDAAALRAYALRLPEPMASSEISDYALAMVKGDRSVDWLAMQIEAEVIRRVKECNE